jgi:C1A family cysteine protease
MKSLLKFMLPALLLSACAGQSLPPAALGPRPLTSQNAPVKRMSTIAKRFPYGLGARVEGTQPMLGESASGFQTLASLPEKIDLRPQFPAVYNQGSTNACVGFSTVGGLGEFFARKRGWNMRFSPRYLWNLGRKMEGSLDQNVGMYLEDAIKVIDNLGMLPEQDYPFSTVDDSNPAFPNVLTQLPSNAQVEQAKKFRISQGWERVPSVHAMKKSLSEGKPVVFAFMIYSSIANAQNGVIPMPTAKDEMIGGHAILAVGYDNVRRHFIIRNSWGAEWGDKGYGYLPYDYFRSDLKMIPVYAGFTIK